MSTFRFPCFNELLFSLGRIDAVCTYAKLAVDELNGQLVRESNPKEALKELGKQNDLVINHVDHNIMPTNISYLFIVITFSQLEDFVNKFIQEHPNSEYWEKRDNEDVITRISRENGALFNKDFKSDLRALKYYRLVRNKFLHQGNSDLSADYKKLLEHTDDEYFRPNPYESINYSDFQLFTRMVKRFAEKICSISKPTNDQIVEMTKKHGFQTLNRFKNNPRRFKNSLKQKFIEVFKLADEELDEIVEHYMRVLA